LRLPQLTGLAVVAVLLFAAPLVFAAEAEKALAEGMQAYQAGDYETAQKLLQPLADSGNRLAAVTLLIIQRSLESEKEAIAKPTIEGGIKSFEMERFDTAYRIFLPLAEQDNAVALMYLGLIKRRQIVREPDAARAALPYFEQAAEMGLPRAQYFAGLAASIVKSPDWAEKSEKWMTLAAHAGVDDAYYPMRRILCSRGEADLANSWAVIDIPDDGFQRTAGEFDSHWHEIEAYWNTHKCDKSQKVTKAFVRAIYQRAQTLIETYGLRMCDAASPCRDVFAPNY